MVIGLGALIVLLFIDVPLFELRGAQHPAISDIVQVACETSGGKYEHWADPSVSCQHPPSPGPGPK